MKSTILWAAVFAVFMAEGATAQTSDANSNANSGSQSNSASTSNTVNQPQATANSNQSTTAVSGSASYGNVGNTTSNTMTPTANSNSNAQTAAESNASNAGNAQTINFNTTTPPEQRVNTTGRVENVISGSTRTETLSTTRSENVISGDQTVHYEYSGTQTIKNVPSLAAAPLTSSNDTCMGSFSAGVALPGLGVTGGSTYSDEHCRRIKMSRELWNKGMKAASLALDCMDQDAREALELTGFVCPQTVRAQRLAEAAARPTRASVAFMPTAQSGHYPPALPAEALALRPVTMQAAPEPAAVETTTVSEAVPAQPAGTPIAAAAPAADGVTVGEAIVIRRVDSVSAAGTPSQ